ncbi:MAG: proline--tRNA ligase, partial [Proteobacteria bacterium]|nr:proline--tRNA ligase [Pseudomonadota bacterium]
LLQTCVEVFSDENGIVLPKIIAPFEVIVMPLNSGDEMIMKEAEEVYKNLLGERIDVLIDDRDMRAGGKFKDADLIGIPVQVRIGRKAREGIFEIKIRKTGEIIEEKKENIVVKIKKILQRGDI